MCSAPVQVKLQVSLQQTTWSGELSGGAPAGNTIDISVFRCVARSFDDSKATRCAASNSTSAAGYALFMMEEQRLIFVIS